MIKCVFSKKEDDLLQILELQQRNLLKNLSNKEIKEQGFLTVEHSLENLQRMNSHENNIILKDSDKVIGYLLAMTKNSKSELPILNPMFQFFDNILYRDKPVSEFNYIIVGQACIDKIYRGKGLLDKCYDEFKKQFSTKYDFAITEIATNNKRSINAHARIGFREIFRYSEQNNTSWSIVILEWKVKT